MPSRTSTTLKLPRELKARIAKLAKRKGRTAHGYMVDALERQITREERMAEFVAEALASDREIDEGGAVYAAEDVHGWLERLVRGERPPSPKPWRG